MPLISICIPTYKRVGFLKRLLDSISTQSFRDFEVIITDDSPDNDARDLSLQYKDEFTIHYFKNHQPLGSPENWNAAIRAANGQWIKMMHDDDWFAGEGSLKDFADAAQKFSKGSFIFSGFYEIDVTGNRKRRFVIGNFNLALLRQSSLHLFKQNFIGHPSTTLIKNRVNLFYDTRFTWVVDVEFYMRYLNLNDGLVAVKKPLINIGLNEFQITKKSFRNPAIEIPEVILLYYELPPRGIRNIFVYDYYWRFVRNLSIRRLQDIENYISSKIEVPEVILRMIKVQSKWSPLLLKNGFISKGLMFYSYLTN